MACVALSSLAPSQPRLSGSGTRAPHNRLRSSSYSGRTSRDAKVKLNLRMFGILCAGASGPKASKASGPVDASGQKPKPVYGPQPPPDRNAKPDWQLLLEEEALHDEEVAELLEECEGNAELIYEKVRGRFNKRTAEIMRERQGRDEGMQVIFREYDPTNLWVWMELYDYPMESERKLVEEVVDAWFTLGHLGAYNCLNLQVLEQGQEVSNMKYDLKHAAEESLLALFHNMDEVEYKGNWARFWLDMGTADELSVDILINSLTQLSREYVGIKQLVVGGINDDWSEGTERKAGGDLFYRLGSAQGKL